MGLREQLQDITIFVSLESETFGDFDRSCDCGPQGILAPSDAWSGTSRQQHAASSCELQLASVVLTKSNESFKRQQLLNKLLLFCFSAICSVALPMISWFVYLVNCIVIMPQTLDIGSIINQLCYGFPDPTLWACWVDLEDPSVCEKYRQNYDQHSAPMIHHNNTLIIFSHHDLPCFHLKTSPSRPWWSPPKRPRLAAACHFRKAGEVLPQRPVA